MSTSEQRLITATPLQQLFFLNSSFVEERARSLACRLESAAPDDTSRIRAAYRMLYQRVPTADEVKVGLEYLKAGSAAWAPFAQALLGANELLFVD
jgi:hypothetical protein